MLGGQISGFLCFFTEICIGSFWLRTIWFWSQILDWVLPPLFRVLKNFLLRIFELRIRTVHAGLTIPRRTKTSKWSTPSKKYGTHLYGRFRFWRYFLGKYQGFRKMMEVNVFEMRKRNYSSSLHFLKKLNTFWKKLNQHRKITRIYTRDLIFRDDFSKNIQFFEKMMRRKIIRLPYPGCLTGQLSQLSHLKWTIRKEFN